MRPHTSEVISRACADSECRARASFYTGKSDLLSDAKAFEACMATRKDGNAALRNFTQDVRPLFPLNASLDYTDAHVLAISQNFISPSTFRDVLSLRTDYLSALSSVGFVPLRVRPDDAAFNVNSQNENLLKAIVFAGTARLVRVKLPKAVFDKGISGAIERERESREVKFFEPEGASLDLLLAAGSHEGLTGPVPQAASSSTRRRCCSRRPSLRRRSSRSSTSRSRPSRSCAMPTRCAGPLAPLACVQTLTLPSVPRCRSRSTPFSSFPRGASRWSSTVA